MKKISAMLLAALMLLTFTACGSETVNTYQPTEAITTEEKSTVTEAISSDEAGGNAPVAVQFERATSLSLNDEGLLLVQRKNRSVTTPMGDEGTWTFFVYLCGTDLESDGGAATADMGEMLDASTSDNVRFIVQTGGTRTWQSSTISSDKLQRYIITGGAMYLADEQPLANMGSPDTLSAFLEWGIANYPAEKMNLVLWNHGGGSISGVCFDENNNSDSLSLSEIETSLSAVYDKMTCKFESVIFDACLMGTVETANILVPYANYMIASEELVSGCGLNYTAIGKAADKNPAEFGEFCDEIFQAHYDDCAMYDQEADVAFSCIDLSKIDALLTAFDVCAKDIYEKTDDADTLSSITRSILSAKNFGGNSRNEGYTNMVDLGDMLDSITVEVANKEEVLAAISNAVVTYKRGANQKKATGLATYYPLSIQGSEELGIFKNICIDPYYLAFVDRAAYGSANSATDDYDDSYWLGEDSSYYWNDYDEATGLSWDDTSYYWDDCDYDCNYYNTDENACALGIEDETYYDDAGNFCLQLSEDSISTLNTAHCSILLDVSDDASLYADLGTDWDVNVDWDTGIISDNFSGYWFCLDDGQPLTAFIIEDEPDYSIFSAPVIVNGKRTNLRIKEDADANLTLEGLFDGIDTNGCASRITGRLEIGDVICPVYPTYDMDAEDEGDDFYGDDYTFEGGNAVIWDTLFDGEYLYAFELTDIYGSYLNSDYANYSVMGGEVYYDAE